MSIELNVMHSHVRGSHRAKFEEDDFNSFRGMASEGHIQTDRQTDTYTQTHTHTRARARTYARTHARTYTHTYTHTHGVVYTKIFKVA